MRGFGLAVILGLLLVQAAGASLAGGPAPGYRWQEDPMAKLYSGGRVTSEAELAAYAGKQAADRIVGEDRRRAFLLNYEQLGINYDDNVEYELRQQQVILCPQTAEYLYRRFTPATVRYRPGSRPALEAIVRKATTACPTQREKMLALMRYCRDLHDERWLEARRFEDYIYGGTEEQLIAKGELLCETLGRLMVALCEIAEMPGRIVMHDIGGHITAEILVDGHWSYVDPRTGFHCVKPDGSLASVWELWHDRTLMNAQPDAVKSEIGDQWSWHERHWKCARKYFDPREVNGFQNYSLADAGNYHYGQRTRADALAAGLNEVNRPYVETANRVFGLDADGSRVTWREASLRKIPLAYRHDGFTMYTGETMTRKSLLNDHVEPFRGTNVEILVWGLGPGSVFCYDTKIGEVFGVPLSDDEWKLMRSVDRRVFENVTGLIRSGSDPLATAVEGAHRIGRKLYARLEMNHEYGPADTGNWKWVGLVGSFNKQHPQFRIPGKVMLDYKFSEVRAFKLGILRESVESGADGIELDFAVYPPYFARPDPAIMTRFVRDVRAMVRAVGAKQKRRIELMARVPNRGALELGLDWKTWMREGLIDIVVPTHFRPADAFDIDIGEFISLRNQTACKVYPTLWQALGFVDTDPRPGDDKTGIRRYDKPKTKEIFFAQAMLFHRAGADGLELGFAAKEWNSRPWLDDLADPAKVEFADKQYMVDPKPYCPVRFKAASGAADDHDHLAEEKRVSLRIGDDPAKAIRLAYRVDAELVLYGRSLKPGESIAVHVNGQGPAILSAAEASSAVHGTTGVARPPDAASVLEKDWWRRGELRLPVPASWWKLGNNEIRLTRSVKQPTPVEELRIIWIDLFLSYHKPQ